MSLKKHNRGIVTELKLTKKVHRLLRYYQNSEFTPKSNNIVNYDNTSDFATAKRDIIKLSWAYISNQVKEKIGYDI